ncbi:phosphatidylserine decarboxylase-related [Rubrobacter xylanophilus DSM 9941]|uniref:Phosphatidylserine decarboxylase-related n=1 Tax=Rubrobacter xylanophilus (strain DSM 9941 / JCM 11954 / NBRC 16129 / PRD-1) TaxID=266117 RepID=Q1AZB4_RUBXD|nr:phosphatidylserine decarboxylase [Rubrobacter xylanophilus]ABG03264.1 phosphatidylserine decarboxylase-related [Rubrobacter xylanophilus DSM 9941]
MTRRSWAAARPYVLGALLPGLALLLLRRRSSGWWLVGLAGALLLFFRDPERRAVRRRGVAYAAADGVISAVERAGDPWIGGEAVRIVTFLSLHNVHVTRSPLAGEVAALEREEGGHLPAFLGGAGRNLGYRVCLEGPEGRAVVEMRAGLVARRITPWVRRGERVGPGQRLGIIHLGSRTDVLLPAGGTGVLVRPGQRVRAGLSPLARREGAR